MKTPSEATTRPTRGRSRLAFLAVLTFAFPRAAAAQLPAVYPVASLSSHHYGNAGAPEWVLLGVAEVPTAYRELQSYRIHGCTVSGQPQVLIANETRAARRFTYVGTQIVEGVSRKRATLGFVSPTGTVWYDAYAVPAEIASSSLGREVVAFDGRLYGYSVDAVTSTERAEAHVFPGGCGGGPIPTGTGRDGFLHCFAEATVTSTWDPATPPGDPRLASYQTTYRVGAREHRLEGRFLRLLTGRAGRIVLTHDGHRVRAHVLAR